jgi:MFS transporter, DHA1 family, multidrug resistance protein
MDISIGWRRMRSSWKWLLALFTAGTLLESMFFGQINSYAPLYLPKIGVAPDDVRIWTGLAVAVANLAGLPFLPFWGALADRYSRKPVIIRSFVIYVLSGLVIIAAGNIWIFLLGRIIGNLALGNSGLMMTTLSERVPVNRQSLAFAIMNGAMPIGAFLGPMAGGPLMDHWGFQGLLSINVVVMMLIVLGMSAGYTDSYSGNNRGPIFKMAADSVKIIFHDRQILWLLVAQLFIFAGWVMAQTYVPLVIKELYHGEDLATTIGIIVGMGGLIAFFIAPLLGAAADRFGRLRLLIIAAVVEFLLLPIPALVNDLGAFAVIWALINGTGSGVFALSFGVLSQTAPDEVRGRVMSFAFLPANMGFMIGPGLGSLVSQAGLFLIFPAAAGLMGIGLVLLAFSAGKKLIEPG